MTPQRAARLGVIGLLADRRGRCSPQFFSEARSADELADAWLGDELIALDEHPATQQDDLRCARHLGALEDVVVAFRMMRGG